MKRNIVQDKLNKRIFGLTLYLLAVVFVMAFIIHIIDNKSNYIFGYTTRIVVSGSMEPEIPTNSLVVIKKCDIEDINVGDIICFEYSQDIIHRVIEISCNDSGKTVVHTKGDSNESADSIEVHDEMLIGEVVGIIDEAVPIIEKYSITPGEVDGVTLSRNITMKLVILGVIIFFATLIVSFINILIKSFMRKDELDKSIDKYLKDIDELLLYRELLRQLNEDEIENSKENKIKFISNRIARAKAEIEMKNLNFAVKDFKRAVKHCIYLNKLGDKFYNKGDK